MTLLKKVIHMRKKKILLVVWVALILGGTVLISHLRQVEFEQHLESTVADFQRRMGTDSHRLENEREALDTSNPEDVFHYLGRQIVLCYYDYFIDFNEYLEKKPRGNLFTGTFVTQADEGALLEGFSIAYDSGWHGIETWADESGAGELFLGYCQHYENENQGFTWEEFENSDEFEQFLSEFYTFIENKEGITLEEAYNQIMGPEKSTRNIYRKALLQSYTYLAETSYSNYQLHKENDFIKALIDAEVLYSVYNCSQEWDTKETVVTTLVPYTKYFTRVHSCILDFSFVFMFSTFIVVAMWMVLSEVGEENKPGISGAPRGHDVNKEHKTMRKKKILLVVWAALLLCGTAIISSYRQEHFEEYLDNTIRDLQEEMETTSHELENDREALDMTNPEDVLQYLELTTGSYCGDYFIDFNEYVKKKPRGNLLTGTFVTQADEGALLEGFVIMATSNSIVRGEFHSMSEQGRVFLDYCQHYENENQGFSWEEFKNSDEFGQFLNEFCNFLENKEDISLQETYQRIEDLGKINTANIYRKALLQSYTYLAETSYSNYQVHKEEDFMKALVDAEVVYTVYDFSQNWDTKQTVVTVREPFQRHIIHVHSSVLDIGFVFMFSTCIVVAIWIVLGEFGKKV
jgi:hypothetical protein